MVGRITIDMNRVEGDLEVQLDVEDNTVRDSWCVGTMYRGYEQILVGRAPSDVLVIVPRICGICSTAQLYAGVRALEDAWGVRPAPNGVRVRNLLGFPRNRGGILYAASDWMTAIFSYSIGGSNPAELCRR